MASEQQNGHVGRADGQECARPRAGGAAPGPGRWPPEDWPARIRALADGTLEPVPPRLAATVMLLRDTPGGPVVHLLRRRASMAFAGGAYAYPGGSVDPRDGHRELRWAGPGADAWAERLGCPPDVAQAVVCAAVRETFEESGVLLAGPDKGSVVEDTTGAGWEADRAALVTHELAFTDFLSRRGLLIRSDLLGGWARWITPEFQERRFDTWFFVCAQPPGQHARDVSGEADRTEWVRPRDAAARYDAGELTMMPPTISTLRQLAGYDSAAAALAGSAGRDMSPVCARTRTEGDDIVLWWPGHGEFTRILRETP